LINALEESKTLPEVAPKFCHKIATMCANPMMKSFFFWPVQKSWING